MDCIVHGVTESDATELLSLSVSAVVKTLPSNAGKVSSILDGGTEILHASRLKNQNINNRSNTVTNSVKTLKMVHIKK